MIRAARYLKVAPWELANQPAAWRNFAEAAMLAENKAGLYDPRRTE